MADKISLATLALAKAYTDESIEGAGAIKGKNCQIQSITNIEGGHRITFAWYNESEVLLTDTLDVMDGEDGAKGDTGNGIVKIEKTATSGLTDTYTITFTDGTTFDYDVVNGADSDVLSVNGKTGNVTLSTNDLVNDSGFIQNTVNNLVNYYLKSQIYTKTEVENIVSAISTLSLDPVEQLPTTDISTSTIYLIPSSSQGVMDQYINLDGTTTGWVKIGDTSIDLTNYVTTSDLTLALADYVTESELSTYVVDANYVHTDNNYTDTDKAIVGGVTSALALKADKSEIPENTSDLTNDSGFITNTVNNLANYYLKSQTYTQAEVDALIAAVKNGRFISVATLPTTDIDTKAIYLVPSADPQTTNIKDEYINIDGTSAGWELIGSTQIDLSGYVTDAELTTALADYTTTSNLTTLLAAKQDTISDLATIRSGASAGASAYQKPSTGIPKTDLASAVQTSLEKADTAVQDISGKADKVSNATNGNFAGLDSNGNLTDSGKSSSDFLPSNTPIPNEVSANPTGTATGTLTKLGIGSDIYEIQGGGGGIDGSTVTPTDVVATWLACAGLHQSYTTINEVLADSGVLSALMASTNAVDYLVRSTTWASSVCANQTAMNYIGNNNYCADVLLADNTWVTAICNSTYFEEVLSISVPVMTSNTTPSGMVSSKSQYQTYAPWYAFDNNDSTFFYGDNNDTNQYIGYEFTVPVNVKKFSIYMKLGVYTPAATWTIQKSTDGSTWTDIGTFTTPQKTTSGEVDFRTTVNLTNSGKVTKYRLFNPIAWLDAGNYSFKILTLQFYGRSDLPPVDDRINAKADKTDIAPVENGTTASRAYAIGQQFYLNGSLYKAKAAIAQGDTFSVSNCELADCVTDQLGNVATLLYEKTIAFVNANTWVEDRNTSININLSGYRKIRLLVGKFLNSANAYPQYGMEEFDLSNIKLAGFTNTIYCCKTINLYGTNGDEYVIEAWAAGLSSSNELKSITDIELMAKKNVSGTNYAFVKIYGIK